MNYIVGFIALCVTIVGISSLLILVIGASTILLRLMGYDIYIKLERRKSWK